MTNKTLSQADYEALARFRQALRHFMAFSDTMLESVGLGPRRYQAMLAIRAQTGETQISVGELAERLLIKPNTAAELVNRLEAAGMIVRVRDPADRRRALLALTDEGSGKLDEVAQIHFAKLEESRAAFVNMFGAQPGFDLDGGAAGLASATARQAGE